MRDEDVEKIVREQVKRELREPFWGINFPKVEISHLEFVYQRLADKVVLSRELSVKKKGGFDRIPLI